MIRSVTVGLPVGARSPAAIEQEVSALFATTNATFGRAGISSRTLRFTLPAMTAAAEEEGMIASCLQWVDRLAETLDVRWYCLPLDLVSEGPRRERLQAALAAVTRFPRMFLNLIVADQRTVSTEAVYDAADLILRISRKTNNGFDNFRVGASCGCPPNTPFFPFSRHEGERVAFSFALETVQAAHALCERVNPRGPIDEFRDHMVEELTAIFSKTNELGLEIEAASGCEFRGIDGSFAPFPNSNASVGALVEKLSGAPVGSHGSVFVTAILTDCIRAALARSGARPAGFNGVMYSLLEDEVLAAANSRRQVSLDGLIAMSTVCACGVDMVPVPGSSFVEEIAAVILDVAAISMALRKPLGARMLPVPGRSANELTHFNLDFLCDSRVVGLTPTDQALHTATPGLGLLSPREPAQDKGGAET